MEETSCPITDIKVITADEVQASEEAGYTVSNFSNLYLALSRGTDNKPLTTESYDDYPLTAIPGSSSNSPLMCEFFVRPAIYDWSLECELKGSPRPDKPSLSLKSERNGGSGAKIMAILALVNTLLLLLVGLPCAIWCREMKMFVFIPVLMIFVLLPFLTWTTCLTTIDYFREVKMIKDDVETISCGYLGWGRDDHFKLDANAMILSL